MVQPAHVLRRFEVSVRKLQGPSQRDKWAGWCGVFFVLLLVFSVATFKIDQNKKKSKQFNRSRQESGK